MKSLLIGMLLLIGISLVHAKDQTDLWLKCLQDGEKQGLSDKNCPAFDKAIDCGAQLMRSYQAHLNGVNGELARTKEELSSFRSTRRRQLMARAVNDFEQSVAEGEKAVAQMQEADAILKREKREAGCGQPPPTFSASGDCSQAETHWKSVEEIKTLSAYQDHLKRFPNCNFAALAVGRIEQLGRQDGDKAANPLAESQPGPERPVTEKALGLGLATMSNDLRNRYKIKDSVNGVVITSVDDSSDAAEKRLSAGDVIVEAAAQAVASAADVNKRIDQVKMDGKKSILLRISNMDGLRFVALSVQ
jgi:hypothetical protein